MEIIKHKRLKFSIRKYVNSQYYGTCYRIGSFEFPTYKDLLKALDLGELSFFEREPKKKYKPDGERIKYINSMYPKSEQKQIKESIERLRIQNETRIQDFLLLDEQLRILKYHFKLTPQQFNEIINKYRVPSKHEKNILRLLN